MWINNSFIPFIHSFIPVSLTFILSFQWKTGWLIWKILLVWLKMLLPGEWHLVVPYYLYWNPNRCRFKAQSSCNNIHFAAKNGILIISVEYTRTCLQGMFSVVCRHRTIMNSRIMFNSRSTQHPKVWVWWIYGACGIEPFCEI